MRYTLQLKTPDGWKDSCEELGFKGHGSDDDNLVRGVAYAVAIKYRNVGHSRIVIHEEKRVLEEFNERGFNVSAAKQDPY